jgi:hypothetical protein
LNATETFPLAGARAGLHRLLYCQEDIGQAAWRQPDRAGITAKS